MASLIFKAVLFAFVALLFHRILKVVIVMGFHRHMFNHYPGPCRIVPGIDVGSEDIITLSNGLAIITSGISMNEEEVWSIQGRIFTFDFKQPDMNVKEVNIISESLNKTLLNPIGISVWEDPATDKVTVFLVNRALPPMTSSIEVFHFGQKSNSLHHTKTIISENIYSPNNIVAMSADTFYVTNDVRFGRLAALEVYLNLPTGTVAYYDGNEAAVVATGFVMSNGINRSLNRKYIYVSGLMDTQIHILKRMEDNFLQPLKKIAMYTSVDNINVDDKGNLWVGCHYLPYTLKLGDPNRSTGTTQVLRVHLDQYLNPSVREVLADDGGVLRGSSVASVYGEKMLVGTVTSQMLYCELQAY
ncbi:serum paraoxonase/arylesterase 2-like [Asterias rubens]|uniref:serum paraoxonase/arylesterase 2-like n=1 Tax=Asterias rubens TaxID=7604 RepID=UPI00145569F7|nr:serum paraoxonase/arylesterase 2-like [Asterias rubens]